MPLRVAKSFYNTIQSSELAMGPKYVRQSTPSALSLLSHPRIFTHSDRAFKPALHLRRSLSTYDSRPHQQKTFSVVVSLRIPVGV